MADSLPVSNPSLFISRDPDYGWLSALEFGRVSDGQKPSCWRPLDENFAYFVPQRARRPRGFHVLNLDEFDPWGSEVEAIWTRPAVREPAARPRRRQRRRGDRRGQGVSRRRADDQPRLLRPGDARPGRGGGEAVALLPRVRRPDGALRPRLHALRARAAPRGLRTPAPLRRARAVQQLELVLARQGGRGNRRDAPRRSVPSSGPSNSPLEATTRPMPRSCWPSSRAVDRIAASDDDIPF